MDKNTMEVNGYRQLVSNILQNNNNNYKKIM